MDEAHDQAARHVLPRWQWPLAQNAHGLGFLSASCDRGIEQTGLHLKGVSGPGVRSDRHLGYTGGYDALYLNM